jgi:BioD-like phosphotransacetylase family protein
MSGLVLLSPAPGAGKTTIAAAIVAKLGGGTLTRLGDDENATADRELFSGLGSEGPAELYEAAGGDPSASAQRAAVVVADGSGEAAELAQFCASAGERLLGVILNRVAQRRREQVLRAVADTGAKILFDLPEDRSLATPSLDEVVGALNATIVFFDSNGKRPLDGLVVASISADPGQAYFAMREARAVVVRSDKPDLQLAALNAGASCLIVTGELPLFGYVKERAEADEIPIIRTKLDTVAAVRSVEQLYATAPFSGTPAKLSRLAALTRDFDARKLSIA